jgi:hypothetical protein
MHCFRKTQPLISGDVDSIGWGGSGDRSFQNTRSRQESSATLVDALTYFAFDGPRFGLKSDVLTTRHLRSVLNVGLIGSVS